MEWIEQPRRQNGRRKPCKNGRPAGKTPSGGVDQAMGGELTILLHRIMKDRAAAFS